jgi:hypothetical protein
VLLNRCVRLLEFVLLYVLVETPYLDPDLTKFGFNTTLTESLLRGTEGGGLRKGN